MDVGPLDAQAHAGQHAGIAKRRNGAVVAVVETHHARPGADPQGCKRRQRLGSCFALSVGNGMPVRIAVGMAEQLGDPQRDVIGDDVLDALGFGMYASERHVERPVEERFEQTMTAHNRDSEAASSSRQTQRRERNAISLQQPFRFELALGFAD